MVLLRNPEKFDGIKAANPLVEVCADDVNCCADADPASANVSDTPRTQMRARTVHLPRFET
jgi:hypothetical protein